MSESDNTNSNDYDLNSHNSDENQLWNKELLKNYTLNIMNLLKSSYFTSSETLSVLLIVIIYQISNKNNKDSYNTDFESWKTIFTAERLVQLEKIQQSCHQIEEVKKSSIIKEKIEVVMKTQQELKSFHQKQLLSESKTHQDLEAHLLKDLFKQVKIDHLRSHAHMNSWSELEKKNPMTKNHQV